MTDLQTRHPMREGELFSEWWDRLWHEGSLSAKAYGRSTRIARHRRGQWVFIPPEWRGRVPNQNQMRQRQSKGPKKFRRQPNPVINGKSYPVPKSERPTIQERRRPTIVQEIDLLGES